MRRSRGFTLTEVVAVIAIIGIMSALLFVSLGGRRNNAALKAAAREVAAAVRVAQSNALTGLSRGVPPGNSICQYGIQGSSSSYKTTVSSSVDCSGGGTSIDLSTYALQNGVVFGSPWSVSFSTPRGVVTSGNISIDLVDGGSHYSVSVNSSGVITEGP